MRYTAKDAGKFRNLLKNANGKRIETEVDGDDLEVILCPDLDATYINVPYNENGDYVSLKVSNGIIKRWSKEAKEGKTLMRRMLSGERNTAYKDIPR